MGRKDKIQRWIDLSELPRWGKGEGLGKIGSINWKKCIGYKVKFIYGEVEGVVEIINYDGEYLHIQYSNEPIFKISSGNFINCGLGKLLNKITKDFKIEVGTRFKDDKRDITIIDRKYIEYAHKPDKKGRVYISNIKYYKYKCNKCGFDCGEHYIKGEYKDEHWITEVSLLTRNAGCSVCCDSPQIVVQGMNDMYTTDYWMIELGVDEQFAKTHRSSTGHKCKVKCSCCGNEKYMRGNDIYTNKSIACPKCGDGFSMPNKIMFNVLKQLNVNFETEYTPNWCKYNFKNKYKNGRYDFYIKLKDKEYIIEMDGGFHKTDNKMNGQTKEESRAIDNYKDKLAEERGFKVVRIDCDYKYNNQFDYVKNNVVNSELIDLFDLSKIDWIECEEFTMTNIKKMICEYWNNKEEWETVASIYKKFNIGKTATLNYLNQGTKLGWCNYNGKEELIKSNKRNGHLSGNPVEIFRGGISLGVFPSSNALSNQSEELLGTKLFSSNITSSLNPNHKKYNKPYKGYTFKFVDKQPQLNPISLA